MHPDRMAKTAFKLLSKYGETVTFIAVAGSGVDGNGDPVQITETYNGKGYPESYSAYEQSSSVIQAGDIKLTCSKISKRPEQGWYCIIDGTKYRVEQLNRSAFPVLTWLIQCS